MSASIARSSPFLARTASLRSSSSRWAFCGGRALVAGRATMGAVARTYSSPCCWLQALCAGPASPSLFAPSPHTLQLGPRVVVEAVAESCRSPLHVSRRADLAEERLRAQLSDFLPGRPTDGRVRRDEKDALGV